MRAEHERHWFQTHSPYIYAERNMFEGGGVSMNDNFQHQKKGMRKRKAKLQKRYKGIHLKEQ